MGRHLSVFESIIHMHNALCQPKQSRFRCGRKALSIDPSGFLRAFFDGVAFLRAFFDGVAQHRICACGVYIIPSDGQQYEIYCNGGAGSNNKVEAMAPAGLLSFCEFLNIQELKIFGDSKMIIDHVRSKHVIKNINLSGWLNRIETIWNRMKDYSIAHIDKEKTQ